jgi:hypothetical protein
MPKYVIERELPGAGQLSSDELHAISNKSNSVLSTMNGRATWLESFVTDDKIFCVYVAEDEDAVREHGSAGGFPVTTISKVAAAIDPSTGE